MYINPMDFTYMQWNKPADLPAELFLFLESLPKEETEHPRLGRVIHAQKFARPILIRYFHEYTHMALCKAMCVYWELDAEERGYFHRSIYNISFWLSYIMELESADFVKETERLNLIIAKQKAELDLLKPKETK